jgi:hypothetical protein
MGHMIRAHKIQFVGPEEKRPLGDLERDGSERNIVQ